MKKLFITKASGATVPFSTRKLRKSLHKAGASGDAVQAILAQLERELYPGISTEALHERAFALLQEANTRWAGRYKLKRAIQELGPSGFPFERFVSKILEMQGFRAKTGVVLAGRCVQHEVDVVASRGDQNILVECKFHSLPGNQSDVKIPLYIKSRFDDIAEAMAAGGRLNDFERWVVTNTRFTGDAVRYGVCAGLHLVGWDFPDKGSLRQMIDRKKLYPLTCLSSLSNREKTALLEQNIVLISDILRHPEALHIIGISDNREETIIQECRQLGA